ncbi:restriction endonuclease subunit S [Klebsiella pneumoniae]|nr:restriction endonuclease subunit S [Klebsiella pneumoniae]
MKTVRLGDYVNIRTGKLDANASDENGDYPFFTCSIKPLRISSYSYDCECVLVAGNGDLNVKYYNGKFDAYQRTYIIQTKDKSILDVKFLYYFMSKYIEILRNQSIGGIIKYIKLSNLTDVNITIPDIDLQKKYVKIIDLAKENVFHKQQQLNLLDELGESLFYKYSEENEITEMSEAIVSTKNGLSRRAQDDYGDIVLKIPNIQPNLIKYDIVNRIKLSENEKGKYKLRAGDLLLIRVNGNENYVGRCAVFEDKNEETYFNDHIIRMRLKNVNEKFVAYYLNSPLGKKEILKNTKTSAGQFTISKNGIEKIKLTLPPHALQNEFAEKIEKIKELKEQFIKNLEYYEELYETLLYKTFNAELFVE